MANRWQRFGGLALFVCLFLPAVEACNEPFVPVREIWKEANNGFELGDLLFIIPIGAPYLIGLGVAVAARGRADQEGNHRRLLGEPAFWLCSASMLCAVVTLKVEWSWEGLALLGIPILHIMYLLVRAKGGGYGACLKFRFAGPLWSTYWFGYWFGATLSSGELPYFGLWLSMAGCLACLYGVYREAAWLSYSGGPSIVHRLLLGRLNVAKDGQPRCVGCGYWLTGLISNRCPECGLSFNLQDSA